MTNITAKSTSPSGRGRPKEHRLENYLTALNAFSKPDALASARDLAALIDTNESQAAEILQKLCGEHVDYRMPLLPLYATQNDNEYRRHKDISMQKKIRPIRLTASQAQQCLDAFNSIGMPQEDPLRRSIIDAYFPIDFDKTAVSQNTSQADANTSFEVLKTCAASLANTVYQENQDGTTSISAPLVKFAYKGANDELTRSHEVIPLLIHLKSDGWNLEAYDRDSKSNKTFRTALIKDCRLLNNTLTIPASSQERPDAGTLRLVCNNSVAQSVLAWKGAHCYSEDADTKTSLEQEGCTVIEIPYFRSGGEWLARHVLSLGNKVSYNDYKVEKEVKRIAKANLKLAKKRGIIK